MDWSALGLGANFYTIWWGNLRVCVTYACLSNNQVKVKYNSYEGECSLEEKCQFAILIFEYK